MRNITQTFNLYDLFARLALFNLLIFFFLHFQRIFPRFFQSRELLFKYPPHVLGMQYLSGYIVIIFISLVY